MLAGTPLELAGVDDDAADSGAVAADPLGERVDDDISAVRDGLGEVRCREGGVNNERQADAVRLLRNLLEIAHDAGRVGDGLAEEGARLLVGRFEEVLGVRLIDEAHRDAKFGQDVVELGVGAAVQVASGDDVVSTLSDVDDGVEDGVGPRGDTEACQGMRALEHGDALLEDIGSRVHEPRIDVAELREGEEVGRVLGRIEDVGRGAVDRDATRGGRIRCVAAMERDSGKSSRLVGDGAVMGG
mmetsp:Transcript_3124/g.9532  ORF Transcript_3124/g.9532 Transcript_3124/m.9532 type:complete len:243 (+) Transcript_3124:1885-2613(+)